jgi:PAS domain S-box-containing protein
LAIISSLPQERSRDRDLKFAGLAEEEHQRLNDVVSNVPGIVWESRIQSKPEDRRIEFISDYVEVILGYTPEEVKAQTNFWMSFVVEEDRPAMIESSQAIIEGRPQGAKQFRCKAKDGSIVWLDAHLAATFDASGKVAGIRGMAIDITDLKLAEEELNSRERELLEAQRLAQIGNWEWDPKTDTVRWSKELYRIAGLDPSQPAPSFERHSQLYSPESFKRLAAAVEEALVNRTTYELELEMIRSDKTQIWVNARGEVHGDNNGNNFKLRGTVQEISDRKKAEQQLTKALDEVSQLKERLHEENVYLTEVINLEHNFDEMVGQSDALKYVLFKIEQVAPTEATVLITGETGTGKELVARSIHHRSLRKDRPLVKVNCAALSPTLIESELFGHERGSFTGAGAKKIGRFELADGATLFLDEIGELPLEMQVKLLRVLQEGEFERLGNSKTIKADVRIIAATNRDLELEVKNGNFRADLMFRLNVFPISVPPLRERKNDIPQLVEHFAARFAKQLGKTITTVSPATMRDLVEYSWPGNIRELSNVIERSIINAQNTNLQIFENLRAPRPDRVSSDPAETLEAHERKYINSVLENVGWKVDGANGAARVLGINPSTLRTRMAKLNIARKPARTREADSV